MVAALSFWAAVQTSPLARSSVAGANAAVVGILAGAPITLVVTSAITGLAPLLTVLACLALLMLTKWPAWAVVLIGAATGLAAVSYTHLTLPTILRSCRSRWSPYH